MPSQYIIQYYISLYICYFYVHFCCADEVRNDKKREKGSLLFLPKVRSCCNNFEKEFVEDLHTEGKKLFTFVVSRGKVGFQKLLFK